MSKRILSVVFCFFLLLSSLTSCSTQEPPKSEITYSGYLENTIGPDASIETMQMMSNNKIVCFEKALTARWTSPDLGESWTRETGWLDNSEGLSRVRHGACIDDSTLLVSADIETDNPIRYNRPVIVKQSGEWTAVPIREIDNLYNEGFKTAIISLYPFDDNSVFVSYAWKPEEHTNPELRKYKEKTGIYNINSGELIYSLDVETVATYYGDDEYLYLLTFTGKILTVDKKTGTRVAALSGKVAIDANSDFAIYAKGANIHVGDMSSVQLFTPESEQADILLQGTEHTFGLLNTGVTSLLVLPNEAIWVLGRNGKITSYQFSDEILRPNILNIYALEDNNTLRVAATLFRAQNPDVYLDIKFAEYDRFDTVKRDDELKVLHTEILAGKGPDVLFLDGLPYQEYIEQGVLVDLSDKLSLEEVYPNIISASRHNGGIYAIPVAIEVPVLLTYENEPKIKTLSKLVATIESDIVADISPFDDFSQQESTDKERPEIYFSSFNTIFDIMWDANAPALISDNKLNNDNLKIFLESIKVVYDKFNLDVLVNNSISLRLSVYSTRLSDSAAALYNHQTNYGGHIWRNNYDAIFFRKITPESKSLKVDLFPSLVQGVFKPTAIVGVNVTSNSIDYSVQFIQTLLSPEVQGNPSISGLPVTPEGNEIAVTALVESLYENAEDEQMPDYYGEIANRLTVINTVSETIRSCIYDNAIAYCEGKSIEECIDEIGSSLSLYLDERAK